MPYLTRLSVEFVATVRGSATSSAGYYGCLGLAIAAISPGLRIGMVITILAVLTIRLSWSSLHLPEEGRVMSADIAHLIAFPLGLLAYRFL